ncbi:hypothetical protein [Halorussus salinisoli]|uniref:hypothetical protein n=1 Tax=Halorussus salinisoli TaxID=2558242 RepID=UPI0010C213D1|nr:hypothetical protein [Halorussus salinisoli]
MNRRELLGTVGAGATGMAGLLGARARASGQETETTTTASDGQEFTGIDSSADRPFATISVGSREGVRNPENNRPHAIRIWNDSGEARTVGLRLFRGGEAGTAILDRRVEFPADGYLTLRLSEPGEYALPLRPGGATTTATDGASTGGTVAVPRSRFDCNDSRTDVRVAPDGAVQSVTISTEIGCPPEVVDRTFTAFSGSCGSADEASVGFGEASVRISGSIRAPTPCHGARLAGVALPSADTLRVTVATTESEADVCAQCVGTVAYRADLGFRDRVPGTVEVVHQRGDEAETVATVSRGEGSTTEAGTTSVRTTTDAEATESETTPSGTTGA